MLEFLNCPRLSMTSYTSGETQLEVKIYLYLNVSCYEFKRIDYGLYENNEIYKIVALSRPLIV